MDTIKNERRDITTDTTETQMIRTHYKNYMPTVGQSGRHELIPIIINPSKTETRENIKSE